MYLENSLKNSLESFPVIYILKFKGFFPSYINMWQKLWFSYPPAFPKETPKAKLKELNLGCQSGVSSLSWNNSGWCCLLLNELLKSKAICYLRCGRTPAFCFCYRNFPSYLVGTMEESRDNIIEFLTEECVSIDSPLDSINSSDVKSTLLTYLLSWLLMLRMFKAATPDNRAKFANTFYKKNYVNELVTCLFCLVPGNWNLDGGSCQCKCIYECKCNVSAVSIFSQ